MPVWELGFELYEMHKMLVLSMGEVSYEEYVPRMKNWTTSSLLILRSTRRWCVTITLTSTSVWHKKNESFYFPVLITIVWKRKRKKRNITSEENIDMYFLLFSARHFIWLWDLLLPLVDDLSIWSWIEWPASLVGEDLHEQVNKLRDFNWA